MECEQYTRPPGSGSSPAVLAGLPLDADTIPPYGISVRHATHTNQLGRLRRIEGQVHGVLGMVEEGRYCVDILTQLRAVHAALRKVEEQILREHVDHCVVGAVRSGRKDDQRAKLDELMDVIGRFSA